jgi:hypothetical protein
MRIISYYKTKNLQTQNVCNDTVFSATCFGAEAPSLESNTNI